jgi:hypothetical protein
VHLTGIRAIACAVCVVSFGADSGAAGDVTSSIRQQVREDGGFERIVVSTDEQLSLATLVGQADLVVEASMTGRRSFLDDSEMHIYTDYTFMVQDVIKTGTLPAVRGGSTITIRREGGTVDVDGRPAVTIENDFPVFDAREPYILFLTQASSGSAYSVLAGPQGAFTAGDAITPVAARLADAAERPSPTSRAAFLGEVRALLKFTE